jgi:hypothetical protein
LSIVQTKSISVVCYSDFLAARGCPSMAERAFDRTGQRQNGQRQTTIAYLISSRDFIFENIITDEFDKKKQKI